MHRPEGAIALRYGRHEHAEGEQVIDLADLLALVCVGLSLAVDAVEVLRASGDLGVEAGAGQLALQYLGDLFDVCLSLAPLGGKEFRYAPVLVRLQVAEGEVLELPLDLAHAEAMGQGGVDIEGLLRYRDAAGRG